MNAERLVEICLQVSGQQANSRSKPLDADGPHLLRLGLRIGGESYSGGWQQQALPRLPEMLTNLDRWRHLWADEDAHLATSLQALAGDDVRVTEHPDVDLAIVDVVSATSAQPVHRFTRGESATIHPMAMNNATNRLRVLTVEGNRYSLELRYESWVMLVSRPVLPRPDLPLLAEG